VLRRSAATKHRGVGGSTHKRVLVNGSEKYAALPSAVWFERLALRVVPAHNTPVCGTTMRVEI
jgi:hypothetical protein